MESWVDGKGWKSEGRLQTKRNKKVVAWVPKRRKAMFSTQKGISSSRAFASPNIFTGGGVAVDYYAQLEKRNKKNPIQRQTVYLPTNVSVKKATKFYNSFEWKELRDSVLQKYGFVCMACGEDDLAVRVDHIKPLRRYWDLRLDFNNMQVLCVECNKNKGNWSETDYRLSTEYIQNRLPSKEKVDVFMQQKTDLALRKRNCIK